ncbi:MAG: lytic murein transglycosylase B [Gammaproteobacteria bacterium]|nr:lytic murein transglycosylase B [Gammaproteobacteria bacterium]
MKKWLLALSVAVSAATSASDFTTERENVSQWIDRVSTEHNIPREDLTLLLGQAERKQSILDAIARPAEKVLTWEEYRQIFMSGSRAQKGAEFWQENAEALQRASDEIGVEPEYIVAIIGVETRYGRIMGSYRVIDALATLAFDYPPRSRFFSSELEQFVLLTRESGKEPTSLYGSYAGAMGYGQFMPSSYRAYARDFSGDGVADIWEDRGDAIASVANYFKRHGWVAGQPVVISLSPSDSADTETDNQIGLSRTMADIEASGFIPSSVVAGDTEANLFYFEGEADAEYYAGLQNFYTITRYNRSAFYAMAVHLLAQEIKREYTAL